MLQILARVPLYMSFRHFGWPRLLPFSLTILPSPRCNSRCQTCNIWKQELDELALDEWDRILTGLGHTPYWFTISGGEPFLYPHLVELVQLAYDRCRPQILTLPTNSILYKRIPDMVERIARYCTDSQVVVNLSLDGVGEKHDQIRGVPGNFERFEANYAALRALDLPNLSLGIHSVISRFNVHEIDELFDYAFGLEPDSYITEIAEERVELNTVGLDIAPQPEDYARATAELTARLQARSFQGFSRITEAFRIEYYRLVNRILVEKRQVLPCYAGWVSAQIHADGTVWPCCVRADAMGNLREADYNFRSVWFSDAAQAIRRSIRAKECYCPLANAAYTNMLHHPVTLLRVGSELVLG